MGYYPYIAYTRRAKETWRAALEPVLIHCSMHTESVVICAAQNRRFRFQGLFRLDAPASNRRQRYCIKMITQRVRCECSNLLTCVLKPARRFYAVKSTPATIMQFMQLFKLADIEICRNTDRRTYMVPYSLAPLESLTRLMAHARIVDSATGDWPPGFHVEDIAEIVRQGFDLTGGPEELDQAALSSGVTMPALTSAHTVYN